VNLDRKTQAVTVRAGKRLLTVPEAAGRLGLQPSTVRFWIWTRRIAHVKVGRAVRISEAVVDEVIARGTVPEAQ
jgi:excisionase family DNA binding protein